MVFVESTTQKWTFLQAHLGADVLQLSVLQPPQHIAGGVASNAEAERMKGRK